MFRQASSGVSSARRCDMLESSRLSYRTEASADRGQSGHIVEEHWVDRYRICAEVVHPWGLEQSIRRVGVPVRSLSGR